MQEGLKVGKVELGQMVSQVLLSSGHGLPNLDRHHQAPSYFGHLKYECRESL